MTLKFSSLGPQPSLNPETWCFSCKWPQAFWPKASVSWSDCILQWCFNEPSGNAETPQSHWSRYGGDGLSTGLPIYSAVCALNSGLTVRRKAPEFWSWQNSGSVPPRDLSSTTHSNPSPNSYQKFPWWEMLLWEGVPALWLTLFH